MKNYFYAILMIWYFTWIFYLKETNFLYSKFTQKIMYFDNIIFILNGIFAIFLTFSVINIIQNNIWKILNKIKNKTIWNLIFEFIKISKYIIAIYVWLQLVNIPEKYWNFIDNIFKVSFVLTLIILLNSFVETIFEWIKKWENYELNKHIIKLLKKVATIFIWWVWVITIIWNLWYNITALVTWAWIWWLALALASQKSVSNIFWAVSIILNRPFKIWDSIKIWLMSWTVKDIWIMYLVITDSNWHDINIPNETIITSPIENFSVRKWRKVDFNILLDVKIEKSKIKKWLWIMEKYLEKLKKNEEIKSFRFAVDSFNETSINIIWTFFSNNPDTEYCNKMKQDFLLEVLESFEKENIWVI